MEKEFKSLSEKINYDIRCAANKGTYFGFLHENHIKEFIKRLKKFCFAIGDDNDREGVLKEIDKLAGDKLI